MRKLFLFSILLIAILVSFVQAQQFSIVIDAQKDAFYESLTGPWDGFVFLPSRCQVIGMGVTPTDDADCSGKIWMAYDNEYLYCYAEVKDDNVLASNSARFENDCVELKLDPDPDAGTGSGTANSRLTALSASDPGVVVSGIDNLNGSNNLRNAANEIWSPTSSDYARRKTNDGYVVEFRIPFQYINRPADNRFMVSRELGNRFGLAINIGDNDGTVREHLLQWSAGHTNDVHTEAKYHGTAYFLPGNRLELDASSPRDISIYNIYADDWYIYRPTGINNESKFVQSFKLLNNYPNPFNPTTTIAFEIPKTERVVLSIYNTLGQEVAKLLNESKSAGYYEVKWNASNMPTGVYFYRLTTGGSIATKKMLLVK